MRRHRLRERSKNSEKLADLCTFGIFINAVISLHKRIHEATWVSLNYTTTNQINQICTDKQLRRPKGSIRKNRGADTGLDHHLVAKLKKH